MALSAFDDRAHPPRPAELKTVLGRSAGLWDHLISHVSAKHAPITEQWSFSGAKFGWSLRLKRKERVVVHMTPQVGRFMVGVALGEKAARAARQRPLPDALLTLIERAPRYAEGRGIRLTVASREDLLVAQNLADVKMAR